MIRSAHIIAAFSLALGGCAGGGRMATDATGAPVGNYLAKSGIKPEQYTADEKECIAIAKKDYDAKRAQRTTIYQPGLAGAAAGGFADGLERGRMKREGIKQAEECMLAKGYRVTPMTKEQAAIYQGLDTDRRIQASAILASGGDIEAFKNAQ
jgi:hypothetical protein